MSEFIGHRCFFSFFFLMWDFLSSRCIFLAEAKNSCTETIKVETEEKNSEKKEKNAPWPINEDK